MAFGVKLCVLAGLVAMLTVVATLTGPFPTAPSEVAAALPRYFDLSGAQIQVGNIDTVLFSVRIPRILAALLTGAALAAAGALYQGSFRNPLVSPDILGVSAGAGLGAALGIFLSPPVVAIQGVVTMYLYDSKRPQARGVGIRI